MSWLKDLGSLAKSAAGFVLGDSIGGQLARTALIGYTINRLQKSMNKENSKPDAANSTRTDTQVREQLIPDVNNAIPVVYGTSFVRGIISDAAMQDQRFMWYCITVCEVTGNLISTGDSSEITFLDMWINGQKVNLDLDGVTVRSLISDDGVTNSKPGGYIKVYFYKNGRSSPVNLNNYGLGNTQNASELFPGWTSSNNMTNLSFVLVRLEYSKENDVTNLGDVYFKVNNSMTLPGDCVFDYMTNTRYGAGIPVSEINL
jgi:hypothetical protein